MLCPLGEIWVSEQQTAVLFSFRVFFELSWFTTGYHRSVLDKMIGQKTINSFFSPVSKKRTSTELIESEEDANEPVSVISFLKQFKF